MISYRRPSCPRIAVARRFSRGQMRIGGCSASVITPSSSFRSAINAWCSPTIAVTLSAGRGDGPCGRTALRARCLRVQHRRGSGHSRCDRPTRRAVSCGRDVGGCGRDDVRRSGTGGEGSHGQNSVAALSCLALPAGAAIRVCSRSRIHECSRPEEYKARISVHHANPARAMSTIAIAEVAPIDCRTAMRRLWDQLDQERDGAIGRHGECAVVPNPVEGSAGRSHEPHGGRTPSVPPFASPAPA